MKVQREKYAPGDRVCHRVGGPDMIIITGISQIGAQKYRCRFWDSKDKCFRFEAFHVFELNGYDPDEQESKKE